MKHAWLCSEDEWGLEEECLSPLNIALKVSF